MISASTIYWVSAIVSLGMLGAVVVGLRTVPDRFRREFLVLAVVLGTGVVTGGMLALGIGRVPLGSDAIDYPSYVNDVVAYSLLWFVAASLADVSKRTLAIVTAVPALQVTAFVFGAAGGGLVGLGSSLFVIGGHVVMAYLFVGPIWREAQALPDARRLLHWKARNLLLFLIAMLIVYAFLSLTGAFTTWATLVINEYISLLIRVGFATFLLVNVGALAGEHVGRVATRGAEATAASEPADD